MNLQHHMVIKMRNLFVLLSLIVLSGSLGMTGVYAKDYTNSLSSGTVYELDRPSGHLEYPLQSVYVEKTNPADATDKQMNIVFTVSHPNKSYLDPQFNYYALYIDKEDGTALPQTKSGSLSFNDPFDNQKYTDTHTETITVPDLGSAYFVYVVLNENSSDIDTKTKALANYNYMLKFKILGNVYNTTDGDQYIHRYDVEPFPNDNSKPYLSPIITTNKTLWSGTLFQKLQSLYSVAASAFDTISNVPDSPLYTSQTQKAPVYDRLKFDEVSGTIYGISEKDPSTNELS